MAANEGDWVPDGPVQPWWIYAFPAKDIFWATIIQLMDKKEAGKPQPDPWKRISGDVVEAGAMLRSIGRISDPVMKQRLLKEATAKLDGAHKQLTTQANGV